jgi:hypothetical protein
MIHRVKQKCFDWVIALSVAVAATAWSGAGWAEQPGALKPLIPTGSRIGRDPEEIKGRQLDRFFDDMARCVVSRAPAKADYFLRMRDDFGIADEIGDATKFLPLSTCVAESAQESAVESQARFSPRSLRNWLSEKSYLAQNKVFVPVAADAAPVPERTYFSRGGLMQGQAYGVFSDCIVHEDAQAADSLVRTARGSQDEHQAAQRLVPAMSACLTEGQTLTLNEMIVRGLAAQGLWQRYEAPKPAQYKAKR